MVRLPHQAPPPLPVLDNRAARLRQAPPLHHRPQKRMQKRQHGVRGASSDALNVARPRRRLKEAEATFVVVQARSDVPDRAASLDLPPGRFTSKAVDGVK